MFRRPIWQVLLIGLLFVASAHPRQSGGAAPQAPTAASKSRFRPQKTVKGTIEQAIKALENNECETVVVDFFNPIQRAKFKDLEANRDKYKCAEHNRASTEELLMAFKLARHAQVEYRGVAAFISLEGSTLSMQKLTLLKYLDGRWYFNFETK